MKLRTALFAGSFDPLTCGHLDIVNRAAALFERVIIALGVNPTKKLLIPVAKNQQFLTEFFADRSEIEVHAYDGLTAKFARDHATVLVRGVRDAQDTGYELKMAMMNHQLCGLDTLFFPVTEELSRVSSSLVKEVHAGGGDVSRWVPPEVMNLLKSY